LAVPAVGGTVVSVPPFEELGFSDLLVVAATGVVVGSALTRAWKVRTGAGLSVGTQTAQLALGLCWLGYYLHAELAVAVFTGVVSLSVYATLTLLAFARGGVRDTPYPLLVILGSVAAGSVLFGSFGAALALGLSPVVAEAPQIRSLLRRDAYALSRGAYLAGFFEAAAWLPYALIQQDLAVALWSSSALAVTFTILALLTRWRHKTIRRSRPRGGDVGRPG
jgi:hypothetical protein